MYPEADPTQPNPKDAHTKIFHRFNIVWHTH